MPKNYIVTNMQASAKERTMLLMIKRKIFCTEGGA
jgi:hypothetical protein